MAIRDIFKISWRTFFNPLGWIDYSSLREQNITIFTILGGLFTPLSPGKPETFEEAKKRLSLTEEGIQSVGRNYRGYAILFLFLGVIVIIYSFYLLFNYSTFIGWILGIAVSGLFFTYAFRYDFWAFQIKRRELGATFADWKNHYFG